MNVFARLFGGAVTVRNQLYDSRVLPARRLARPVVSVGNISVGGSGKTPFVIHLAELLRSRDIRIDVLSRGYRRSSTDTVAVDPAGSPKEFGDEPLLIARTLAVPVIVGRDRYAAGRLAEECFETDLHVLDDGFQHRRLARDFDVVLLTPEDENDSLLPIGRLREPHSSLQRADAVILMRGARAESFPLARKRVWVAERGIDVGELPSRPLVFCGVAKPAVFFGQVRAHGAKPGAQISFRDHHTYTARDIKRLLDVARQRGTDGFVTTEKDVINLGALAESLRPLDVVRPTLRVRGGDDFIDYLLATIQARRAKPS